MVNRSALLARRNVSLAALCALTIGVVSISLSGCGGSGGGGTTVDAPGSKAQVTAGQTLLNTMLNSKVDPTYDNLSSLRATFLDAYNKDKSNKQAKFGYATSDVALSSQKVIDAINGVFHSKSRGKTDPITQTAQQANPWRATRPGVDSTRKILGLAWKMPGAISNLTRSRQVDAEKIRVVVREMFDRLNEDLPLLESLAQDSTFSFDIANFREGSGTITMDQADLQSVLTGLYGVRAVLAIALAYDFNPRGFDFNKSVGDVFGNKTDGSLVTRDEYLPVTPFGNLMSDGKADFASAKSDLKKGADEAVIAVTNLHARINQSNRLIDGSDITSDDVKLVQDDATKFKSGLEGEITLDDGSAINAAIWFNNPPASLRAFEPTYHVSIVKDFNGDPKPLLTAENADFPDPTFGGLIVKPRGDLKVQVSWHGNMGDLASGSNDYYYYNYGN